MATCPDVDRQSSPRSPPPSRYLVLVLVLVRTTSTYLRYLAQKSYLPCCALVNCTREESAFFQLLAASLMHDAAGRRRTPCPVR